MDTKISLPSDLKTKIEREANARGMSLPDFVRESLEWAVTQKPSVTQKPLITQKQLGDPLFADTAVYRDDGPSDFASNHDDYLYGDAP